MQRIITRTTYSLAGQPVAVRVVGDPDSTNNGRFYLYSDHLGSASAMTDAVGNPVGDVVRYYPFGDYRTEPTAGLTDHDFTGHKQNDGLGLIYMNA